MAKSRMVKIPKRTKEQVEKKYHTQRGRYTKLATKGYSQGAIAKAYNVSKKTVWMALTSRLKAKEKV